MSKIHQNVSGCPLAWKSFIVPADYVYGTINGFNFIAVPIADRKFRKVPIVEVRQKTRLISKAKKDYPAISSAIIDAILDCKTLKLLSWDYMADFKKAVKADIAAKNHKMVVSAHANRASAGKKAAHRTKAFRVEQNFFTAEYNNASARIYGTSVEMNGRKRKCSGKTAEYLDGSGCCAVDFDNHDFRPLAPVFPVPSGKKAR